MNTNQIKTSLTLEDEVEQLKDQVAKLNHFMLQLLTHQRNQNILWFDWYNYGAELEVSEPEEDK